ncbi:MAG TPA: hypothetical protein VII63_08475 [Caulobacteraceae bacterium]
MAFISVARFAPAAAAAAAAWASGEGPGRLKISPRSQLARAARAPIMAGAGP